MAIITHKVTPRTDQNGYILGTIYDISFDYTWSTDNNNLRWTIKFGYANGTEKTLYFWTGVKITPERYLYQNCTRYTKLTRLLISLGEIDEDELVSGKLTGYALDTDGLEGVSVSFKRVQESPGDFPQIDLDDIHFTEVEEYE